MAVDVGGVSGGGDYSEDEGSSAIDEMSGLMDKLLGECSKWLEIFTPQVFMHVHMMRQK